MSLVVRYVLRFRWVLLGLAWLATVPQTWDVRQGDWHYFRTGAHLLAGHGPGGGLHVFASHPEMHMGPLSFVVTWLVQLGGTNGLARAEFLMWALCPLTLLLLEKAAMQWRQDGDRLREHLVVLVGGWMLIQSWANAAGIMAHLDDVLTMTFGALAVWALAHRRPVLLAIAVGLATAGKAWGILLLPLCFAPHLPRPRRSLLTGIVAVALPWLPFMIADRATFTPSSFGQVIDSASALRALGAAGNQMPHWVRPTQVLVGVTFAAVLVRRGRWGAAIAAAMAVRISLDPSIWGYYLPTFVFAALVLDLVAARHPLPIATTVTYIGMAIAPWYVSDRASLGEIRLATTAFVAAAAILTPLLRRRTRDAVEIWQPAAMPPDARAAI